MRICGYFYRILVAIFVSYTNFMYGIVINYEVGCVCVKQHF